MMITCSGVIDSPNRVSYFARATGNRELRSAESDPSEADTVRRVTSTSGGLTAERLGGGVAGWRRLTRAQGEYTVVEPGGTELDRAAPLQIAREQPQHDIVPLLQLPEQVGHARQGYV